MNKNIWNTLNSNFSTLYAIETSRYISIEQMLTLDQFVTFRKLPKTNGCIARGPMTGLQQDIGTSQCESGHSVVQ